MDMGDLRGLSTILCMLAFAAVVYWAYGPSRKEYFEEAAEILFVSAKTIEGHRAQIMRKLNIHNIAGLTKFAVKEGLTSLDIWP